jgi:2-hydroxycyclohexanecarboxyl-CoA dehydrogenase
MRGLAGRRVILTGGASGIGRAAALRLAAEGCVLGIFDLDEAGARETAAQCAQAQAYRVDITDREQIAAAAAAFGRADGLANVAGWDTPVVVVRGMADRGFDRVVNVASDAGRVSSSGEAVYSACKGGIIAFTKEPRRQHVRGSDGPAAERR